jgi:hypothetical protein
MTSLLKSRMDPEFPSNCCLIIFISMTEKQQLKTCLWLQYFLVQRNCWWYMVPWLAVNIFKFTIFDQRNLAYPTVLKSQGSILSSLHISDVHRNHCVCLPRPLCWSNMYILYIPQRRLCSQQPHLDGVMVSMLEHKNTWISLRPATHHRYRPVQIHLTFNGQDLCKWSETWCGNLWWKEFTENKAFRTFRVHHLFKIEQLHANIN